MKRLLFSLCFAITCLWVNAQQTLTAPTKMTEVTQSMSSDSTIVIPVIPDGGITVEWLFSPENGVFAFLLYILMYLSGYIPFLQKLDDKRLRALIVGVLLAGGFTVWQLFQKDLTWQDFAGMAFAFISTQLTYIFVLAPIPALKTRRPENKG